MAGARVRVSGDRFHPSVPAGAVYVGRPAPGLPGSPFRNRHRIGSCSVCGVEHDRAAAVLAYVQDLDADPQLVDRARRELAGAADLACRCQPGLLCHVDPLLAVVDGMAPAAWIEQFYRELAED